MCFFLFFFKSFSLKCIEMPIYTGSRSWLLLDLTRRRELLLSGWQALQPGGILVWLSGPAKVSEMPSSLPQVYSTCTLNKEENELQPHP